LWVCTASALTSVATTAKPRPASPARAASMVELSASSVVCRAICAIRLTTLPIAAEDSPRRSTLARASLAAALARSASLPASRTCAPMPTADWVNFSAACAKVVAVPCAALVRPVKASVRRRISASVAAVASAPPATALAARSSWRIMPPSSSSSSSRICPAESASAAAVAAASDAAAGSGAFGSLAGSGGRGTRFRSKPNAMRSFGDNCQLRISSLHSRVNSWLRIPSCSGTGHYRPTENGFQTFDFAPGAAYKAALPDPRIRPDESAKRDRMAGHSQFKNIMHRKGRQDAQKSKLFGKLAREITVAAKLGTPDPAMNPRLRAAIVAARQENMPKDNIERAIKKALGGEGDNYDEIRYEGYGPGGVAIIV